MVAAERVAATVAQGLHGRRRVGTGENFWQFRPFVAGDPVARIDWRRSARSDQLYLRETEWDAAQTVALWCDAAPGMGWRSSPALPTKRARAQLAALALASLLLRGGERVRLLDGTEANAAGLTAGPAALPRLAAALGSALPGLPQALPPAHAHLVLFGDWLGPLAPLAALLARSTAQALRGVVVQVLDPAEITLPFAGRVRFVAPDGAAPAEIVVPKVEAVRAAYAEKLAERQAQLAALCRGAGLGFVVHRTDAPAEALLLRLHQLLSGRPDR